MKEKESIVVGVERAVTRWYVQRQVILNEAAQLEAQLARASASTQDLSSEATVRTDNQAAQVVELQHQLVRTQEKLRALGPCPKPMMG